MSDKSNSAPWTRGVFLWVTNLALALAGAACLLHGVLALWVLDDSTLAITGLVAGLVFLLAASIERFEVLKGLGMEARTRKLDEAISQANATIEQLRELAELSGESVIFLSAKTGRWNSSPTLEQATAVAERVRQHLENLGSKPETIRATLEPWVKNALHDQSLRLLNEIRKPNLEAQQELNAKLQSYPVPIDAGDPNYQALLDQRALFSGYELNTVGKVNTWLIGTHSTKLTQLVDNMPLLKEDIRPQLRNIIAPWLTRFDYLATYYKLSEQEAWFRASEKT